MFFKNSVLFFIVLFVSFSLFGKEIISVSLLSREESICKFVKDLNQLWEDEYPDLPFVWDCEKVENIQTPLHQVIQKKVRFAIVPIRFIPQKKIILKESEQLLDKPTNQIKSIDDIRIISILWDHYWIPLSTTQKNSKEKYYIPNGLLGDSLHQQLSSFATPLMIDKWEEILNISDNFFFLYEIAGPNQYFIQPSEKKLFPTSFSKKELALLKNKFHFLTPITIDLEKNEKVETVGIKWVFITHKEEENQIIWRQLELFKKKFRIFSRPTFFPQKYELTTLKKWVPSNRIHTALFEKPIEKINNK